MKYNHLNYKTKMYAWESAEILKLIITNFKSIDNRLKSVEVIRPIKSINAENSSHLTIKMLPVTYILYIICCCMLEKYVFWNN